MSAHAHVSHRYAAIAALLVLGRSGPSFAQSLDPQVRGDLRLAPLLTGLSAPIAAQYTPDGRLVVIEQGGDIIVVRGGNRTNAGTIAVEQSFAEQGLLGLAVDPRFADSNRLYFYYSAANTPTENRHKVAWATLDPVTDQVDVANRTVILENISGINNHNGGGLAFDANGLLYVGAGDNGCNCGCAPGSTSGRNWFGTCLTNAQGKILRVDRDGNIPNTNPLVGVADVAACGAEFSCGGNGARMEPNQANRGAPRTEIYLWGFRNPWRFTFDSQTGYLWIGDVGEVTYEEITVSRTGGQHHGWPFREGVHGQPVSTCATYTPGFGDCVEPVFEVPQSEAPASGSGSITGGVFSNHCSWPSGWRGRYWFGDYVKSRVWTVTPNGARDGVTGGKSTIVTAADGPVHFFNGLNGSVGFVAINGGAIFEILPANPAPCTTDDGGVAADVTTGDDAGTIPGDSGTPSGDAAPLPDGAPPADATSPADAAAQSDAGPRADSGGGGASDGGTTGERGSGCGCSTQGTRGRSPAAFAFIALAVWSLRRRRFLALGAGNPGPER
ncbi:MAG: PQQ-dependent sugar dehydrogenase [Deltaproteobacteria bacterium]|nr:PQQ-dependent sugar dehydrogenase [Deltaproteobacteria bacterium]